jgi:hypothetical protein
MCQRLPCLFRDYVDEERAEKQVAAIMQKTLDRQDSLGRKFFYAISRSDFKSFTQANVALAMCMLTLDLQSLCDARTETCFVSVSAVPFKCWEAGWQLTKALKT